MNKKEHFFHQLFAVLFIISILIDLYYFASLHDTKLKLDVPPPMVYRLLLLPLTAVFVGKVFMNLIMRSNQLSVRHNHSFIWGMAVKTFIMAYFIFTGSLVLICYFISPNGSTVMILLDMLEKISNFFILLFVVGGILERYSEKTEPFLDFCGVGVFGVCVLVSSVFLIGKTISMDEFEETAKAEAKKYDVELNLNFKSRSLLTPFDLERELWIIRRNVNN